MKIRSIEYNDDHGCSKIIEVGKDDVENIIEHQAQGEGDRWFYDVKYSNGNVDRMFNVVKVSFINTN